MSFIKGLLRELWMTFRQLWAVALSKSPTPRPRLPLIREGATSRAQIIVCRKAGKHGVLISVFLQHKAVLLSLSLALTPQR